MAGKILFVDDESYQEEIFSTYTKGIGLEIDYYTNPLKAVEAYQQNGGYDLVITDFSMPEMDGYGVCSEIKKINPDAVVLLRTNSWDIDKKRFNGTVSKDHINIEDRQDFIQSILKYIPQTT